MVTCTKSTHQNPKVSAFSRGNLTDSADWPRGIATWGNVSDAGAKKLAKRAEEMYDEIARKLDGLKAIEPGWITARQIEASRIVISRVVRKIGKMWIRIFPDKPVTARPAETRMGKGKGALDHWVAVIKPGKILFEIDGVTKDEADRAFRDAGHKLPMKTKVVERRAF